MDLSDTPNREYLSTLGFLNTNLKDSVLSATLQGKTLLCFVTDDSEISSQWQQVISDNRFRSRLVAQTVSLKINAETQEAEYLKGVCTLNGCPAVIIIKAGAIEHNLQHPLTSVFDLRTKFESMFAPLAPEQDFSLYEDPFPITDDPLPWHSWIARLPHFRWIWQYTDEVYDNSSQESIPPSEQTFDDPATNPYIYIILPPSAGRMRLPNNAYDALGIQTQKWLDQNIRGDNVLKLQLKLLRNIPAMAEHIAAIESRPQGTPPTIDIEYQDRLLNTPASALKIAPSPNPQTADSTRTRSPPAQQETATIASDPERAVENGLATRVPSSETSHSAQQRQRSDYIRMQREREQAQRAERERIKAQIASDRAERRRADEQRRQAERASELNDLRRANSTTVNPQNTDIRIQVRTFDGSTIKTTFEHSASVNKDVRPWIDKTSEQSVPYNLKLILTPLPNRNIEASEERQSLSDLGIVGSATMVMVPVKDYVESYTGSSGLVGAVTGVVGGVFGGLSSLVGWGSPNNSTPIQESPTTPVAHSSSVPPTEPKVRVRTLADQRAEEAQKRGNELYNGNQLNFEGRKDDDNNDQKPNEV